jgi:hypothetical protein
LTTGTSVTDGHATQDKTLGHKKLTEFFAFFGLSGKQTPEVWDRALRFIALRNCLYHHSPEMRDIREYPDQVIAALKDAGIEPVNTSWAAQCTDVRLAKWAAEAVRSFIDDLCRARGIPSRMQLHGWEFDGSEATSKLKQPDAAFDAGERVLLFCAASGTDWQHAGITGENVTAMVIKGVIERDAVGAIALTDRGRAVLRAMLPDL